MRTSASMSQRTALITGALGQDGRLLTEHLLGLNYQVIGLVKPGSALLTDGRPAAMHWDCTGLTDTRGIRSLLEQWRPDEIYHLAAFHHSSQENSAGVLLASREAMLTNNFLSTKTLAFAIVETQVPAHLVFAASSQMFTAESENHEITETSPRKPSTFYGHVKSWGMDLLAFLRMEHGIRASTAILFNHESPLRGEQFVSRKITRAAAAAKRGFPVKLELQNIGARVDWSSARDVVRAMQLLATAKDPQDYVVASGKLHSVREMLEVAFGHVGLDWEKHVIFNHDRPIPALVGRSEKLRETLRWQPGLKFSNLITEMVDYDLSHIARP